MTEENSMNLRTIRRALLSVSDKTGLLEFAGLLSKFNVEIISTGGTARALREAGLTVTDVSAVTEFPEMMDGRVKTLHPRIHGGLLGLRDNAEHRAAMQAHGIEPIDLVVVNLYPFEATIARVDVALADAIENIDIGGPSMLRSAAKNYRDVAVVVSPDDYAALSEELQANDGALTLASRAQLARKTFLRTALYDAAIASYLDAQFADNKSESESSAQADGENASQSAENEFPATQIQINLNRRAVLRYGENPHQQAALYADGTTGGGVANAEILGGKEMSYNNFIDADAAWQLINDFDEPACAIIKHTNPAGVGLGATMAEAYRRALQTDPVSAFGGIIAFNRAVDEAAAKAAAEIFTEVIIAPAFDEAALAVLRKKKNLRVLRATTAKRVGEVEFRQISGGVLAQSPDTHILAADALQVVTKRAPSAEEIADLLFAWTVCKHTKSNAIVLARGGQTVGVGAGQMNRVDSVRIAVARAQRTELSLQGSALASDAFFPFRDGVDEAAQHGIAAIIQPGGSIRDEEVIQAADENGIAMVFTGIRHFKH